MIAWIAECKNDLETAGTGALVLAGSRQSKVVKQIAAALNEKLGSSAIRPVQTDLGKYGDLADLTEKA